MSRTSIDVDYLFTMTAQVEMPPHSNIAGGPHGTRLIVPVVGGSFEGPKLKGSVVPPGGDWLTMRDDGFGKLDVRALLVTDDGASIYMTYNGIGNFVKGEIRTAPLFETGDERYSWLNNVQAISLGTPGDGSVTYEVYAVT